MSLTEEPYYEKRDCSPMCNHQEECVRCHSPHCIKYMYHSRLHGYTCLCGSQEWKPVFGFSNPVKRVNKRLQRTAIAASQQAQLFTDGNLPSKARGAKRSLPCRINEK